MDNKDDYDRERFTRIYTVDGRPVTLVSANRNRMEFHEPKKKRYMPLYRYRTGTAYRRK